jgi:hypothetical protein
MTDETVENKAAHIDGVANPVDGTALPDGRVDASQFEAHMAVARHVMHERRTVLRELAK